MMRRTRTLFREPLIVRIGLLGLSTALLLLSAPTARADALIVVDLVSDYAPGTEVAATRTRLFREASEAHLVSPLHFVVPSDPLATGIRVYEAPSVPSGWWTISVELIAPSGEVFRTVSTGHWVRDTPTILQLGASRSGGRLNTAEAYWTSWTSEEHPPIACAPGYAVDGHGCEGSFCDDMRLHCRRMPGLQGGRASSEGPVTAFTTPESAVGCGFLPPAERSSWMVGLECDEGFCGSITIDCQATAAYAGTLCEDPRLETLDFFGPSVSEEEPGSFFFTRPQYNCYATKFGCTFGDANCDNSQLGFRAASPVVVATYDGPSDLGRCLQFDTAGPLLDACRDGLAPTFEGDLDRFEMGEDGRIRQGPDDLCVSLADAAEAGVALDFAACEQSPAWVRDAWGLVHLAEQPELCLGFESGDDLPRPVVLEPCAEAPFWFLPGPFSPARTAAPPLLISERVEGSGSNQAVEVWNGSDSEIELSDYAIHVFTDDAQGDSPDRVVPLAGVLAGSDVHVVSRQDPATSPTLIALSDQTDPDLVFDENDTLLLFDTRNGVVVDGFGQLGVVVPTFSDPDTSAADRTLTRREHVCFGDRDPFDTFRPSEEWQEKPVDDFGDLGQRSFTCDPQAVPEPSSALLWSLGSLATAWLGRRRIGRS